MDFFLNEIVGKNRSTHTQYFSSPINVENRVPFSPGSNEYNIDYVIDNFDITIDHLRSSDSLNILLKNIISLINENELIYTWTKQTVKVRLDALINLLISQLCIPHFMSLFGVGSFSELDENGNTEKYNFILGVKSILKRAFSLLKRSEELILIKGSDQELDEERFELFISLVKIKSTPIVPNVLIIRDFGKRALEWISRGILSVSALNSSITNSIHLVITRLTNLLSHDERKSTIIDNHDQIKFIIMDYFYWLRENNDQLVKICRKEEILYSVDAKVRAWLRSENYSSPVDIMNVYNRKYKKFLTHMTIPLQPYKKQDIEQAVKDIIRETITINKVKFSGGRLSDQTSTEEPITPTQTIKNELIKLMAFLFEIDTLAVNKKNSSIFSSAHTSKESLLEFDESEEDIDDDILNKGSQCLANDSNRLDNPFQSNTLNDTIPELFNRENVTNAKKNQSKEALNGQNRTKFSENLSKYQYLNRVEWHSQLIEILYFYTLLAASRTFASGDAFLILNDLYGGDGLMFCPSKDIKRTLPDKKKTNISTKPLSSKPHKSDKSDDVDAQIAITASGIKVILKERYNLYAETSMQTCTNLDQLSPLINFECTTTTLIILSPEHQQMILSNNQSIPPDDIQEIKYISQVERTVKATQCFKLFQILINNPELICQRAVTIEPFV